jgi:hypothetical protein
MENIMKINNDQYRREQILRSLAVYSDETSDKGLKQTLTVEYRGNMKILPVITIDPKILLLNHNNNRLSAQLLDHPDRQLVYGNPTSEQAQSLLSNLLGQTEEFSNLKSELDQIGQQNPGLITRNGLLVNGNTRVVALRQLGSNGVNVAVLPDDADDSAILDLEMSLQMVHLTHQDYTFTNELLLIEKCRRVGNNDRQIADKMKWSRGWQKKLDEKFQLLKLINEIRTESNPPLAYQVFDTKSQHLKDLNEKYQSLKNIDLLAANNMKWSRIIAIFLNVNKDQTRAIDEEFIDIDVLKRIDNDSPTLELLDSLKKVQPTNDGLDDILGDVSQHDEKVDVKALARKIIADRVDTSGHITVELNPTLEELKKKVVLAAEDIITKDKRKSLLATPAENLQEIRENLENVVNVFNEVSLLKGFDAKKFEYELNKANKSLNDLMKKFTKFKSS